MKDELLNSLYYKKRFWQGNFNIQWITSYPNCMVWDETNVPIIFPTEAHADQSPITAPRLLCPNQLPIIETCNQSRISVHKKLQKLSLTSVNLLYEIIITKVEEWQMQHLNQTNLIHKVTFKINTKALKQITTSKIN